MGLVITKMISNAVLFLFSCEKTIQFKGRRECFVICVAFVMRVERPKWGGGDKRKNNNRGAGKGVLGEVGEKHKLGPESTVQSGCAPCLRLLMSHITWPSGNPTHALPGAPSFTHSITGPPSQWLSNCVISRPLKLWERLKDV